MDRPMSLNGYGWVEGNMPNMVDPNGKWPILTPTDSLSHFVNSDCGLSDETSFLEIVFSKWRQFISMVMNPTHCQRFIRALDINIGILAEHLGYHRDRGGILEWDSEIIILTLSEHYSKLRFPENGIGVPWLDEIDIERYPMTNIETQTGVCGDRCSANSANPLYYSDNEEGRQLREIYGFKRFFFDNTHHFFAFLGASVFLTPGIANRQDFDREGGNLCRKAQGYCRTLRGISPPAGEVNQSLPEYRLWYDDAAADRYVVHLATSFLREMRGFSGADNIRDLPSWLESRICAQSEDEIWNEMDNVILQDYAYHQFLPENVENNCDEILRSDCHSDIFSTLP